MSQFFNPFISKKTKQTKTQKYDVLICPIGMTDKRSQLAAFPYPMTKNALAAMIPKPTKRETNYVAAIWLPFQFQVEFNFYF
jgi:hypothetical protein